MLDKVKDLSKIEANLVNRMGVVAQGKATAMILLELLRNHQSV